MGPVGAITRPEDKPASKHIPLARGSSRATAAELLSIFRTPVSEDVSPPLTTLGNNSMDSAYDKDVSETSVATSSASYSGDQRTVSRRISDVPIAQVAVTTPNDDSDV